jgi:hypothetical protein
MTTVGKTIVRRLKWFSELLRENRCKKHPRYRAARPPRVDCSECKALYEVTCARRRKHEADARGVADDGQGS